MAGFHGEKHALGGLVQNSNKGEGQDLKTILYSLRPLITSTSDAVIVEEECCCPLDCFPSHRQPSYNSCDNKDRQIQDNSSPLPLFAANSQRLRLLPGKGMYVGVISGGKTSCPLTTSGISIKGERLRGFPAVS